MRRGHERIIRNKKKETVKLADEGSVTTVLLSCVIYCMGSLQKRIWEGVEEEGEEEERPSEFM